MGSEEVIPYPALAFTIGSLAQLIAPKIADAVVTPVVEPL